MKWIYSVFMVALMGLMASCGKDAYSSLDKSADFREFKSYAWLPTQKDTTDGNVFDNEITYVNLREAANKEMKARGYVMDTEDPDMLLMLRTDFQEESEVVRNYAYSGFYYPGYYANPWYPYYYGGYYGGFYSQPFAYDYDVYNYVRGTVIIDVIDRDKKQLIWRGWSDERISDYGDIEDLYNEVEDIFDEYPVKENKKIKKNK